MTPAKPPLPTAWNFPFHPQTGSQTSILMSESLEGANTAPTRQNPGRVENCEAAGPPAVGGVKAPAATVFADVIVVFGNLREARLSQDAASPGDAVRESIARIGKKPTKETRPARFIETSVRGCNAPRVWGFYYGCCVTRLA